MKVVYIYHALAIRGGIERVWVEKMNQLVRLYQYDVYLLTYNQGDHPVPFILDSRVHHIDLKVRTHQKYSYSGWKRISMGYRLRKLFCKKVSEAFATIRPDVIMAINSPELPLILQVRGNIPVVLESHCGYDEHFKTRKWPPLLRSLALRRCLNEMNAIVTLTEQDARKWRQHFNNVLVIPNVASLNPLGRYSDCKAKRVIFVGRLAAQKGLPDLFAIWRIVHQRQPDWQLDIYGDGELKEQVQREIEQAHANINLHPSVNDIFSCYVCSSIFVLTSVYEPFGLVIPEAMSCGLPVVAFDCDGPRSIITDGSDGFLVRDRSIPDFADRVCRLIDDEALRRQMGTNAIQSSQRFTSEHIMPQWKSFYESVANASPRCPSCR